MRLDSAWKNEDGTQAFRTGRYVHDVLLTVTSARSAEMFEGRHGGMSRGERGFEIICVRMGENVRREGFRWRRTGENGTT